MLNVLKIITLLALAPSFILADKADYDPDTYEPSQATCKPPPLTFRVARNTWDGKTSKVDSISVRAFPGQSTWNKVHTEVTNRPIEDGESFQIRSNSWKQQLGVGLCVETCDFESLGIRFQHDCVGVYGDTSLYYKSDENNREVAVNINKRRTTEPKLTYNKTGHCVKFEGSNACQPLPEHFRGQRLRAIGAVWNQNSATIVN